MTGRKRTVHYPLAVDRLLDDSRLQGLQVTTTGIGPERVARVVDRSAASVLEATEIPQPGVGWWCHPDTTDH